MRCVVHASRVKNIAVYHYEQPGHKPTACVLVVPCASRFCIRYSVYFMNIPRERGRNAVDDTCCQLATRNKCNAAITHFYSTITGRRRASSDPRVYSQTCSVPRQTFSRQAYYHFAYMNICNNYLYPCKPLVNAVVSGLNYEL